MLTCRYVNLSISLLLVVHLTFVGQLQRPITQPRRHHNAHTKVAHADKDRLSTQPLADSVAQTVAQLQTVKSDPDDDGVPVAARPLLTTLKHQLRDLIGDTLNVVQPRDQTGAAQAQARVLSALKRSHVRVQELPAVIDAKEYMSHPYTYGDIYSIKLKQPAALRDVLVATTTVGVCCGEDTSLYLFEKRGTKWMFTLTQEANGYADVSGAQGMFDYGIAPDHVGRFFVVTTNVNPWCTSNWQSLRYSVLRVGKRPETPQVLKHGDETIYLGVDNPYNLNVTRRGFSLDFEGESTPDEINRRHHLTYRINKAGAQLLHRD